MAAKIHTTLGSPRERLRQMAIVFNVPIRMTIVGELYTTAMSPTQFFVRFGGGSPKRVAQHFAVLEKHGWLRKVGPVRPETRRTGPPETLYRATELVIFDAETWSLLPYSVRLALSWGTFIDVARELRRGITNVFFEDRPSHPLRCRRLELDELGWERVIARLNADFATFFEEHKDAKLRTENSDEELIRAGILLTGFESPTNDGDIALRLTDTSSELPIPLPKRLVPILADDLCMQIVNELNKQDMSVMKFYRGVATGTRESEIRHRFGRLRSLAWINVIEKAEKQGGTANIYRATRPSVRTADDLSSDVPEELQETASWGQFVRFTELFKEAILAGTFDIRDDRHFSWSIVNLDQRGWQEVLATLKALEIFLKKEQGNAERRIARGARPLAMVVGLTALESSVSPDRAP